MLVIFGEQLIVAVGPGWNSNLVSGCALQQLSDVTVLDVLVVDRLRSQNLSVAIRVS